MSIILAGGLLPDVARCGDRLQGDPPLHVEDSAYVEDLAWEAEDVHTTPEWMARREPYSIGIVSTFMQKAIGGYQTGSGTRSVARCPFAISCSRYAMQAIQQHGPIVGLMLFIDRNLYRENPGTPYMYPLLETENKTLKLDDSFFLHGHDHPDARD